MDLGYGILLCSGIILLIGGLVYDPPYKYYTFLRHLLLWCGVVAAYQERAEGSTTLALVGLLVAVVFNPFFPIELGEKLYWVPIDIGTAIFLVVIFIRFYRRSR